MTATATVSKPRSRKTRSGGIALSGETLRRVIRDLEPAVPARSPKPILQNVLLANGRAIATDLELRIEVPMPAATGPAMLLPFARLKAIASTLNGSDEVTLTLDGSSCVVTAGGGEWRLPVEDAAEFPAATVKDGASIGRLPADQLASLLNAVRFATDTESSRYALGAVCIQFDRGTADAEESCITFVATDGRRMAASEAKVSAQDLDNSQTLVPSRAVNALVRLAGSAEAVQMTSTGSEFVAVLGDYAEGAGVTGTMLRARLTDGRFPRWQDVDKSYDEPKSLAVVGDLAHAIDMASICTSESSKGVDLAITATGLVLSAKSADAGAARVESELVQAGHEVVVKIDPAFASEWLSCGSFDKAETVTIEARDAQSAVVLRCGHCRTVIMPMAAE
jgi:DNA polymerase-3 subunit beta